MSGVWIIAGWLLAIAGVVVAAWALFWDRPRGRRRCPKCWYDMAGSQGLKCPECGHLASDERRLSKTRHRMGWLLMGLVLMLSGHLAGRAPDIQQSGLVGAAPDTGLIWWVSRYEPPEKYIRAKQAMSAPTPMAVELARRAGAGRLWSWQARWLLRGLGAIEARSRWPRDVPFEIRSGVPTWLLGPAWNSFQIWRADGSEYRHPGREVPLTLDVLENDTNQIDLKVKLGEWSGPWRVQVKRVDTAEQAIEAVLGAELDASVRRALDACMYREDNAATATSYLLGARLYRDKGPVPKDLAIGVIVEFRRQDEVVGSWPLSLRDSAFGSEPVDWSRINPPGPGWNESDPAEMGLWSVRVRGDAATAMHDLGRDRYWAGTYTVPLKEFIRKR